MAEGQVLIKDLLEATEVDDSAYLPIDDGELTKKISVENFNKSSNVTAKAYAEAAAASAQTASDTVANINQKVDQAQGYANAAQTQAGYASTYADNAQTYAGNAQGYANTASGHATNAGASASAASASADASADNALLAQSWVEGNTGAREGENTNNARYWANKAQSAAQITIDDHLDPQSTNPVENRVIYNALNDMHTGGSNIEITTTQTSLYGKDVTISDGTTTVTETFDLTGKALFEGVLMTGDLTITSSDGTSTATGTLTVPYFGNYTKAIAFWQATIAVTTTTSQFNGLTVSAKKNGAVVATGTFSSGSATITVPETGTYKLEVTLDWQTYESSSISVTDQTTYNATLNGFIAPISLTTPTSEFYGQSISVTRNGVAVPVSLAFSNSGTASFTALDEGTYLFTLTYGGEPYTASVVVSAETTYSAVIKMWTATINITTPSSQMQSQDIDVYKGSAKVATIAFNASGQASYLAHESGTYHFVCTVDGYPFTSADVVASDETVYSTSITYFGATLNISTSSSDLYSQTITIKKGSTVVGTTAFSAQGSASYTVHETGTYTCECEGYSGSATVSAETTYNVTINAGLALSAWITAGSTTEYPLNPSSYADFSALEADEAVVRQLMTVHASVDFLAQAEAGDSLMQSVINSDVCAKWINLRDYALDTLSANSDIKDVMDTANKYGYGEWAKINNTWQAVGNVPVMTSNTAPYGVASAYQVFDGNASTSASGTDFSYQSVNPICVKKFECDVNGGTLQGSNDGSTYTTISNPSTNTTYYMYHRVHFGSSQAVHTLQFYGRELKPLVPTMTSNTTPKGQASASSLFDATKPAFQAFDGNVNTMWASTENTNDQWVEYDFVNSVKPCQYYIKPFITISGSSSYSKTAQVAVQGYVNNAWVNISGKTLVSNSTTTATNTTPSEIRGNITNPAEINKIRANFGEKVGVQRDVIAIFQAYGMDYSEKEFAAGSTRKTIYDHGVKPSGAIIGGTDDGNNLTLSAVGTATVTIDKGTRTYMGGKVGLHASGTNRLKCGSGYSNFTASNMPDSNGFDISSISGSVAVGIEQTASGTFDCTEIWIE